MGFLDRFISKFTNKVANKASDKLADKAVNKIFGKNAQNDVQPAESVQSNDNAQVNQPTQTINVETVKVPTMDASQIAMMSAMAGQGMAQANEVMKYLILNDNMEVIGVKDDAPDYLKIAFKNGKFDN